MTDLERLPKSWQERASTYERVFSGMAPNPHDGRRFTRPHDQPISFVFACDPSVRAEISRKQDAFHVVVSMGAYLRLRSTALLVVKCEDVRSDAKTLCDPRIASRMAPAADLARVCITLFRQHRRLDDLCLDVQSIFDKLNYSEPIDTHYSPFGTESETIVFYCLYFLVFHEFGHFWDGHFALKDDAKVRARAKAALKHHHGNAFWRVVETQADGYGAGSLADLVLAAPQLQYYIEREITAGVENFIYSNSQAAGIALAATLDMLDRMNIRFVGSEAAAYGHVDIRLNAAVQFYAMHVNGLMGHHLAAIAFEGLATGITSYSVALDTSNEERIRTEAEHGVEGSKLAKAGMEELVSAVAKAFTDMSLLSEILIDFLPGGLNVEEMQASNTARADNLFDSSKVVGFPFTHSLRQARNGKT